MMALASVCHVLAGCSHGAQPAATGNPAQRTSSSPAVATAVCDSHSLKPEDLAGILSAPITANQARSR